MSAFQRFGILAFGFWCLLNAPTALELSAHFGKYEFKRFEILAGGPGTATDGANPTAQMLQTILLMGGIGVFMWLTMFRPQQKRAKELEAMLKSLRAGDKIVTTSGIVGVVLSLKDKTISIRSSDTKLEILKSAVAEVTERSGETSSS